MWALLFKIIYFKSKVAGRRVYFDANCYRKIGTSYDAKAVKTLVKKMRAKERCRGIDVRLSYLVAAELFVHLADDPAKRYYRECKYGLIATIEHIGKKEKRMLPGPDSEMQQFVFRTLPEDERVRQKSLIDFILALDRSSFADAEIGKYIAQYQKTGQYLQGLKDSWVDLFLNQFIQKHDPAFQGGWQVFAQDQAKRTTLLNEINAAEISGGIYREFAAGVCLYLINGFNEQNPRITERTLQRIIKRFKPIFQLQLRIIKLICQNGYNLQGKRQNEIVDYLIMISFNPANTIFVSNETANLVPNLHALGYQGKVMSLNEYLETLQLKERL